MKKWEEIIKDRLEEQDGALPEELFSEFRARLDARGSGDKADHRLLWILGTLAAASLAAVLFIHKPAVPGNESQIIGQPLYPATAKIDEADIPEPAQLRAEGSHPILREQADPADVHTQKVEIVDNDEPEVNGSSDSADLDDSGPDNVPVSPFIPETLVKDYSKNKVSLLAGSVAGGGSFAAIVAHLIYSGASMNTSVVPGRDITFDSGNQPGMPPQEDYPTGKCRHHYPLVTGGLSAGIPVANRLKITTGIEYSQYRSEFSWCFVDKSTHNISDGEKEQLVRYLGVPLRLDWSLVRNEWLDVYFGVGAKADFCVGATLADARIGVPRIVEKLERDGVSFSLIGAAGSQLNINKRIGVYLEPELIWTGGKPSSQKIRIIPGYDIDGPILPAPEFSGIKTYRSEHPFMFSIAAGFRINLGIN